MPSGVTLLDDLEETVIATVTAPMREEELDEGDRRSWPRAAKVPNEAAGEESADGEATEDAGDGEASSEE